MKDSLILQAYEVARERYAALGIDTDAVLQKLQDIQISLHCWQADDVTGFENAGSLSGVVPKSGFEPVKGAAAASQGLLVVAHAAELTVSRIDFGDDELVASDWIIPLAAKGAAGNIDERAPEFWADTSLRVVPGEVLGKGLSYKVEWPPVLAKHTGVRAHSYEVDVLLPTADGEREAVVKRIYVLSPNFCRAESRDTVPISCRFQADGLPPGAVPRFRVTPISSFGVRGRSISN